MLRLLRINNVALIENLSIEFDDGLNVLSGETGAGKSIIIDSLNFVLGGKPHKSMIRNGKDNLKVEALFLPPFTIEVIAKAKDLGITLNEELLLSRTYNQAGRGDIRINGNIVTASMLKAITTALVDIHGQYEHQSLLNDKNNINIIDNYGDKEIILLKNEYLNALSMLKQINDEIDSLGSDEAQRERTIDLLSYQIKEIENFGIKIGEEDSLREKRNLYLNAEKIANAYRSTIELLNGNNVISSIKLAENELSNIQKYNSDLNDIVNRLNSTRIELDDIITTVKDMQSNLDFDQYDFDKIDNRLDELKLLKKKYGSDEQAIINFYNNAKTEYNRLIDGEENLKILNAKKLLIIKDLTQKANNLSIARKKVAKNFKDKVNKSFESLAMKNAKFDIVFDTVDFTNSGIDNIKFLFSANIGQPLKSLSEIISGGEMSRFMLAIKSIISDKDNISTVVFDEIDTGISGTVGYEIACKMASISQSHQVIAVSHLPQISAMADNRYLIHKDVKDNQTYTNIDLLDEIGSVYEVARLSGGDGNKESLIHAEKLIEKCNLYKKSL